MSSNDYKCVIVEITFKNGQRLSVNGEIRYGTVGGKGGYNKCFYMPLKSSFTDDKHEVAYFDNEAIVFGVRPPTHRHYGVAKEMAYYVLDSAKDMGRKYGGFAMVCNSCNHGYITEKHLKYELKNNYPYSFENCSCGKIRFIKEYGNE